MARIVIYKFLALLSLTALTARAQDAGVVAQAAPLSIEEIVQRASRALARKPAKLACVVDLKAVQLDSEGKPTETQASELIATWTNGIDDEGIPYQRSLDGKPYSAEEMKKADEEDKNKRLEMKQHETQGEGGSMDSPLLGAQVARHVFALLRTEIMDGKNVYTISVAPRSNKRDETALTREGTICIDAQSFLPFRSQTHAAPLPKHVDKMEIDEEFSLTARGEAVPKHLHLEVSGGFLFIHRAYQIDTQWHDCK